jgi:hypothetical protein
MSVPLPTRWLLALAAVAAAGLFSPVTAKPPDLPIDPEVKRLPQPITPAGSDVLFPVAEPTEPVPACPRVVRVCGEELVVAYERIGAPVEMEQLTVMPHEAEAIEVMPTEAEESEAEEEWLYDLRYIPEKLRVSVRRCPTGTFRLGVGVNTDAGLAGSIWLNECNYDITLVPPCWNDFVAGRAFRGAGQEMRLTPCQAEPCPTPIAVNERNFDLAHAANTQVMLKLAVLEIDRGAARRKVLVLDGQRPSVVRHADGAEVWEAIRELKCEGQVDCLTRPQVITLSGHRAVCQVGSDRQKIELSCVPTVVGEGLIRVATELTVAGYGEELDTDNAGVVAEVKVGETATLGGFCRGCCHGKELVLVITPEVLTPPQPEPKPCPPACDETSLKAEEAHALYELAEKHRKQGAHERACYFYKKACELVLADSPQRYSRDPNRRMRELLNESEDLRQVQHEWQRIWLNDQPSHLTPKQICDEPAPAATKPNGGDVPPCEAKPACPSKEKGIEQRLQESVNVNFCDTPLRKALDDLSTWQGVNITVDRHALEDAGISIDRPVTIRADEVSLKGVMNLMLHPLGLGWCVSDNVVKVTTREGARGKLQMRAFQVADLVVPQTEDEGTTGEAELIRLITSTVEPRSWAIMGGQGTIDYFPLTMTLVINQTPAIQEQVADFLAGLRRRAAAGEAERQVAALMGRCHAEFRQGRYAEAQAFAAQALALMPGHPVAAAALHACLAVPRAPRHDEPAHCTYGATMRRPSLPPVDPEVVKALQKILLEMEKGAAEEAEPARERETPRGEESSPLFLEADEPPALEIVDEGVELKLPR